MELIFLTYINRSGSTFLANLFSKSEEILVCPEAEIIMNEFLVEPMKKISWESNMRSKLKNCFLTDHKLKYWNLQMDEIDNLLKAKTNFDAFYYILLAYQRKVKPYATKIVFKAERLIHIYQSFPKSLKLKHNIRFIAIIRDCRSVYASQSSNVILETLKPMSNNPVKIAILWNKYVAKCSVYGNESDFFIVKFEDLINDFKNTFSYLLNKLKLSNIETDTSMGDLFDRIPVNQKHLHQHIRQPPLTEKIASWKNKLSTRDRLLIEIIASKRLRIMDYDVEVFRLSNILVIPVMMVFFFKYYIILLKMKVNYRIRYYYS